MRTDPESVSTTHVRWFVVHGDEGDDVGVTGCALVNTVVKVDAKDSRAAHNATAGYQRM